MCCFIVFNPSPWQLAKNILLYTYFCVNFFFTRVSHGLKTCEWSLWGWCKYRGGRRGGQSWRWRCSSRSSSRTPAGCRSSSCSQNLKNKYLWSIARTLRILYFDLALSLYPEKLERGGPCRLLKLNCIGTRRVQMKAVLSWLVRWASRAGTRDFCSALTSLVGPVLKIFSSPYIISLSM